MGKDRPLTDLLHRECFDRHIRNLCSVISVLERQGKFYPGYEEIVVPLGFAVIYCVPIFYFRLGSGVARELRQDSRQLATLQGQGCGRRYCMAFRNLASDSALQYWQSNCKNTEV